MKGILEGGLELQGKFKKDSEENPLITVITSVFNGGKYFEDAIKSVLDQRYQNLQYIVIDGGSSDNTLEILNRYTNQIDYWKSEKDEGIFDAWNKGLSYSRGSWIAFLGSDDIFSPDAIQQYVDFILGNRDQKLEYISSKVELVTNDLKLVRYLGTSWNWNTFKRFMCVAHVGSLHNRSIFNKYGCFDISYKVSGDYEFLLRPKQDLKAGFLDCLTAKMRSGGNSTRNLLPHTETFRAKVNTAMQPRLKCYLEMILAILKHRTRFLIGKV